MARTSNTSTSSASQNKEAEAHSLSLLGAHIAALARRPTNEGRGERLRPEGAARKGQEIARRRRGRKPPGQKPLQRGCSLQPCTRAQRCVGSGGRGAWRSCEPPWLHWPRGALRGSLLITVAKRWHFLCMEGGSGVGLCEPMEPTCYRRGSPCWQESQRRNQQKVSLGTGRG